MSRKIALFGLGNELHIDDWPQETIVAVGTLAPEKSTPHNIEMNGRQIPVVTVEHLRKMAFDFVIITDTSQFNKIYKACALAQIPQFKIISYALNIEIFYLFVFTFPMFIK